MQPISLGQVAATAANADAKSFVALALAQATATALSNEQQASIASVLRTLKSTPGLSDAALRELDNAIAVLTPEGG